ncbi:hypothetical protein Cal7507_3338 [Calothrix sp. PCC 7507]|nr:hypothetical protein Cal7507_3338 [Calothrix sp. PCC 7507]
MLPKKSRSFPRSLDFIAGSRLLVMSLSHAEAQRKKRRGDNRAKGSLREATPTLGDF